MSETNSKNLNNKRDDEFKTVKNSVRNKQRERKIRKKRKRANRIKSFLRFGIFLLLSYFMYRFYNLSGWYLPQNTFKNASPQRIEIINNKIVPSYVFYNTLRDETIRHIPIFMMRVNPIKKEIYKNIPIIKNVYVRRYGFPARITVIVEERIPTAMIKTDLNARTDLIFTYDEKLLPNKSYMNLKDYVPALKILTTKQSIEKDITVKRVREIKEIVKAVEEYSNEKVEYIDIRNPNDVYVKINTANIRLGTLDSTVFERIKRIYTILPQIKDINNQIQYIDLSWDKVNYLKIEKNDK